MNLDDLKNLYKNANNINGINVINQVEKTHLESGLSYNKCITYLLANCTSKIDKKILNTIENIYPYEGELTIEDINKINIKYEYLPEHKEQEQQQKILFLKLKPFEETGLKPKKRISLSYKRKMNTIEGASDKDIINERKNK